MWKYILSNRTIWYPIQFCKKTRLGVLFIFHILQVFSCFTQKTFFSPQIEKIIVSYSTKKILRTISSSLLILRIDILISYASVGIVSSRIQVTALTKYYYPRIHFHFSRTSPPPLVLNFPLYNCRRKEFRGEKFKSTVRN